VSVIIPACNAATKVAEAIASVRRQTYPVAEILVIDDGSTDGTAEAAEQQGGVRLLRQANAGPSSARNHGLALAGGDLLAFLDADDLWPPRRLEALAGVLTREPAVEAVLGRTQDLWESAEDVPHLGPPYRSFIVGSALFRRSVFERVQGFEPSLRSGEDVDLWVRIGEQGIQRRAVDDVTLYYRRKLIDPIDGMKRHQAGLLQAVRRSLERQRAARVKSGRDG
jgi:glycosyltransferase involved in cell wall biosynthesis